MYVNIYIYVFSHTNWFYLFQSTNNCTQRKTNKSSSILYHSSTQERRIIINTFFYVPPEICPAYTNICCMCVCMYGEYLFFFYTSGKIVYILFDILFCFFPLPSTLEVVFKKALSHFLHNSIVFHCVNIAKVI